MMPRQGKSLCADTKASFITTLKLKNLIRGYGFSVRRYLSLH